MTETDIGGLAPAGNTPFSLPTGATAEIIAEVANRYGYTYRDMVGDDLSRRMAKVRAMAYFEVRKRRPHLSYPQIGEAFRKDHSTVIYGVNRHEARMVWVEFLIFAANGSYQPDLFQ